MSGTAVLRAAVSLDRHRRGTISAALLGPPGAWSSAEARLELNDGRVFTSTQPCINDFDVSEKLYVGADGILSKRKIKRILGAIDHIERFRDIGDFMRIAAG